LRSELGQIDYGGDAETPGPLGLRRYLLKGRLCGELAGLLGRVGFRLQAVQEIDSTLRLRCSGKDRVLVPV
jgi:hypothetical protein